MQYIHSDKAPKAVGPYSLAVKANGFVFVSGQLPLDPGSGLIVEGSAEEQTFRVLQNIEAILESAGSNISKVIKTTVFVTDMANFQAINKVYSEFFGDHRPARSLVEVSKLPKEKALLEMEVIALA